MRVARAVFGLVALVAGTFGVIMLVAPEDTDTYFAWPIGPPALAATVGGCYIASAVVFALGAASTDWHRVRSLCFGGLALTVPTSFATLYDSEVFDFGRFLAIVWVLLFVVSPIVFVAILVAQRPETEPPSALLRPGTRGVFMALGLGFGVLAVAAWLDPEELGERAPFLMAALGGRFIGSWCAFLAALALYASFHSRRADAFIPAVALTVTPLMALIAAMRSWDDLASGRRTAYVVVLVVLAAIGGGLVTACREPAPSFRGS